MIAGIDPIRSSFVPAPGRERSPSHCGWTSVWFRFASDHLVADRFEADAPTQVVAEIPEQAIGLDIGPETASCYASEAANAKTIFWNGPMGVFEMAPFAAGTRRVATAVANSAATSVVGGGDSLAAIHQLGLENRIDHLSTGGGASLEYVQGLTLPGVAALEQ